MCHTYVRNIFGGRRTLANEGRSREEVELLTYCCLGNSTKCSSSSSRPHLSLLLCFLHSFSPHLCYSLLNSSRTLPCRRAVSLHRGVASTYSWKVLAEAYAIVARTCDVDRIRIRRKILLAVAVWDNKLKCAHTRDSFSSIVLSVRISYSFLLKFSFLILER